MAHECPECGMSCHCNGDIDDISFGEDPNCICSSSEWGCGKYDGEEDEWDYDYEEWREYNVPKTQ